MAEEKKQLKITLFSSHIMMKDLEDDINKFLARTDIEIEQIFPIGGILAVTYYKKVAVS